MSSPFLLTFFAMGFIFFAVIGIAIAIAYIRYYRVEIFLTIARGFGKITLMLCKAAKRMEDAKDVTD